MYDDEYGSKEKEMEVFGKCSILRMPREHHCSTVLTWTPMGKKKVGRPNTTWHSTVEKERAMAGWKQTRALAKDRSKRKRSSAALCAT